MTLPDFRDRLIDVLLEEELGCEKVPDISAKVAVRLQSRRRMMRWYLPLSAAAAMAIVALTGWLIFRYPNPAAYGDFTVADGTRVSRGASLFIGPKGAVIKLGGYCRIDAAPEAVVRIEGDRKAEAVFLESGSLACAVDRSRGAFSVHSAAATVSVTGTRFDVEVLHEKGAGEDQPPRLAVSVQAGAVDIECGGVHSTLSAGETRKFGATQKTAKHAPVTGGRITVTGMARATGNPAGNLDPMAANATLTVTKKNADGIDSETVYYVNGWAGVILAKQADGKKAEVSGTIGYKDGRYTLIGKSVDVKVIVVDEKRP
jgi:hypothetical protein